MKKLINANEKVSVKKTAKRKKVLTLGEKKKKEQDRIKKKFNDCIVKMFTYAGFESYKTENKVFSLGLRDHELDNLFKYENILILCERTTGQKDNDHIRKKQQTINIILENKEKFLSYLEEQYPDMNISKYTVNRYIIKYLYFSMNKLDITNDEEELFSPIKFVSTNTFNYFLNISSCLKKSAIFEIFKYLCISKSDVGIKTTKSYSNEFNLTVLHPTDYDMKNRPSCYTLKTTMLHTEVHLTTH